MIFCSFAAMAASDVPGTCDQQVMDSMDNEARSQAQQDLETTQNLVTKPDSVLAYSCFDQYIGVAAVKGAEIFSDADLSTDTGGVTGDDFFSKLKDSDLGKALSQLAPEQWSQMLDTMSGLNSANVLLKMSPEDMQKTLSTMTEGQKAQLKAKLIHELPENADQLLSGDLQSQSLEQIMSKMKGLPTGTLSSLVPELSSTQLQDFVNLLPSDVLSQFKNLLPNIFGGHNKTDPKKLDKVMEATLLPSEKSYLDANFGNSFLGGRVPVDYKPLDTITSGKYNCDRMNAVWQMAKCQNFQSIPAQDGFKAMADYASGSDPRQLPAACPKSPEWAKMYKASTTDPAWQSDDWKNNKQPTYLPESEGSDCSKAKIIKGLEIPQLDGTSKFEYTCSIRGCIYKDGSCVKE